MKQIRWLLTSRRALAVARPESDTALYDAALAALLAQAVHPPGALDRWKARVCSMLRRLGTGLRDAAMRLHHRRRGDGQSERLPPEHWFWL